MILRVSDHALVRFLERAGGCELEPLRAAIGASLERAVVAAGQLGTDAVDIHADGLVYVVREWTLVTIIDPKRRP